MLQIESRAYAAMVGHAYDGLPDEACGLLGGRHQRASVELFVPCPNIDGSSRTYSIGPDGWRLAEEALDPLGLDVVGVMHSHTHTSAYPSPTDVDKADNPLLAGWHFIIVSLREEAPVLRAFVIEDRNISEEAVVLTGR
ncbi:MAG: M67 family metallopeptidase [Acidimicrobiales bacterium]